MCVSRQIASGVGYTGRVAVVCQFILFLSALVVEEQTRQQGRNEINREFWITKYEEDFRSKISIQLKYTKELVASLSSCLLSRAPSLDRSLNRSQREKRKEREREWKREEEKRQNKHRIGYYQIQTPVREWKKKSKERWEILTERWNNNLDGEKKKKRGREEE